MKKVLHYSLVAVIALCMIVMAAATLGHHVIDPISCTACGICADVCPEEAISEGVVDGKDVYVIDLEKCTDCGDCVEECPDESISSTLDEATEKTEE